MGKSHELESLRKAQEHTQAYQNEEEHVTRHLMLAGKKIIELGLIQSLQDPEKQVQPAGVDFSLKQVAKLESSGVVDFDNSKRILPEYQPVEFDTNDMVRLEQGVYMVEFNETVSLPNNIIGIMRTRSSVFRSGATLTAGVIDPGYSGAIGALLQIWNKKGTTLSKNARLVQWIFAEVNEPSKKVYEGIYKHAKSMF